MKASSYIDEKTNTRLAFGGMLASHSGVFTDEQVKFYLQNENRGKIPELLATAALLGRSQALALVTSAETSGASMPIPSELARHWENRWKTVYDIKPDFSGMVIPKPPTRFKARLVVMHENGSSSPELLYRANEKLMRGSCTHWKFCGNQSLDEAVPKHKFTGTFGCWVADDDEAPFGNLDGINLSTRAVRALGNQLGLRTTTLPVRLVLGADVFLESDSKKQLDQKVVTMCAESETVDGLVPSVCFDSGGAKVCVVDWDPDDVCGDVRFRPAVYLEF